MLNKFVIASMLGPVFLVVGCAHSVMRGSVAMKVSEQEAHVCINKDEVKVGDRVVLYKSVCRSGGVIERRGATSCEKVKQGEGVVTEILNEHYSVVKFDPGVPFQEGSFVEKK